MNNIKQELAKCAYCGKCRAVCPVHRALGDELQLARGRVALMDAYFSDKLGPSDKLADAIATCLKCRQCETNCPSNVKVTPLVIAAKEKLLSERREGKWSARILERIVASRKRFDFAIRAASLAGKLFGRKKAATLRHLPMLLCGRRNIPELASKSALNKYPEIVKPKGKVTGRVGLFVGCLENYAAVRVIDAVVKILLAAGREVIIPKGQLCCGLPAATLGHAGIARQFADNNISEFERANVDVIITACATCTGMLANGYAEFLDMKKDFTAPVIDFIEIVDSLDLPAKLLDLRTTYHDPCHHTHRGIKDLPRKLLARMSDYQEMPDAARCCGGGGSFSLFYYDTSQKIGQIKVDAIRKVNPDVVVTSCPGCMLQLDDLVSGEIPVKHIAEVIALSLSLREA